VASDTPVAVDTPVASDTPVAVDTPVASDTPADRSIDAPSDHPTLDAAPDVHPDATDVSPAVDVTDVHPDTTPVDAGPCGGCPAGFTCVGTVCTASVATDFSATTNPTGVWSYAWSPTRTGARAVYDNPFVSSAISIWGRAGEATATPGLEYNGTGADITFSDTTVPRGTVNVHPGPSDEHSVIRFTAPVAGSYRVRVAFAGRTTGGATTDVALVRGSSELFSTNLNAAGTGNTARFATTLTLATGDTVDVAVGYGANLNYYSDTTGVDFVVTISDPTACTVTTSGLVAYLPLDGDTTDRSGNGHDGVSASATSVASGRRGGAYAFNGTNSSVCLGGSGTVTGDRTWCAWVNYGGRTGSGEPIVRGGPAGAADFLGIASPGQTDSCGGTPGGPFVDHWGTACNRSTTATATSGAWSFVCMAHTTGTNTFHFYANGANSTTTGAVYDYPVSTLCVGANGIGGSTTFPSFLGSIDEVTVWSRTLSTAEMDALYGSGAGCTLE
ncbi:MAG: LamG-like jellyroll fold domain-containing protein, partial [Deltaproteobacteria bacterium]